MITKVINLSTPKLLDSQLRKLYLHQVETIGSRIKKVREAIGISQDALAKKAGVSQVIISKLESGKALESRKAGAIAAALNVSAQWLTTGHGSPQIGLSANKSIQNVTEFNINETKNHYNFAGIGREYRLEVPVISYVQAGSWEEANDEFHPGDATDWIPRMNKHGPHTFGLRVEGDSMTSTVLGQRSYPAGIIIYVDPGQEITNGCRVVAKLVDSGEVTFKTYIEDMGKKYLKPINPTYDKIEIDGNCQIIGKVVGVYWEE